MKPFFIASMLVALTLSSCGLGGESKNKNQTTAAPRPLKIIVIEDFSWSQQREKKISMQALFQLADSISKCGGLLSYGIISDDSFKPFTELLIEEPPLSPEKSEEKNPFKKQKKEAQLVANEAHQSQLKARQIENDNKIATFLNSVERIKKKTVYARHSDVNNAFSRAAQTVCAPNSGFSIAPNTFVIVASDLINEWIGGNRTRFEGFDCPLKNPMLVVGAQGSGNLDLKPGTYLNLQSIEEAVRYVFAHNKININKN